MKEQNRRLRVCPNHSTTYILGLEIVKVKYKVFNMLSIYITHSRALYLFQHLSLGDMA